MGTLQSILSVGTKAEETKPAGLNDAASMTVARATKRKKNDNQQVVRQQPSRKSKTRTLQSILSVGTKAEETKPAGLNDAASMTVARATKRKKNDNQQVVRQQPSRKSKTTLVPLKKTTTTKMQLRTSKKRKIATLTKKANQPPKKRQKKAKAPTRKEDSGKKKEAAATNASESSMSEPHKQEQEDAEDEDPVPGDHKRCPVCLSLIHI